MHCAQPSKVIMGAAATVASRSSPDPHNRNGPIAVCCEACKVSLGVFKRKKCAVCMKLHCSRCLSSRPTHFDCRSACIKCHSLFSGDYTPNYLMSCFTVDELRNFLVRHNVPIDNSAEKCDLIELMIQRQQPSSNVRRNGSAGVFIASASEENTNVSSLLVEGSSHQQPHVVQQSNENELHTTPDVIQREPANLASNVVDVIPDFNNVDMTHLYRTTEEGVGRILPRHRVTLADLRSKQDIDALSIRQLKDVLIRNYVDYKGCCERKELVDRVVLLWNDHERMKADGIGNESCNADGKETCKICMDCPMDCILLECGHMVSCTSCGKRLAECPICRQYVSRVVHVFRA